MKSREGGASRQLVTPVASMQGVIFSQFFSSSHQSSEWLCGTEFLSGVNPQQSFLEPSVGHKGLPDDRSEQSILKYK